MALLEINCFFSRSKSILGNDGLIVPTNNALAFSEEIILAINQINCKDEKMKPNIFCKRFINYFSKKIMVLKFLEIWQ